MEPEYKCFNIKNMCGITLSQSVIFIGVFTLVVSLTSVILSSVNLALICCSEEPIILKPMKTLDLILALVFVALASYQFLISVFLLWQSSRDKPKVFLVSLWYVSHLSIVTLYAMMIFTRVVVCFSVKEHFSAVVTLMAGIGYIGIYIYFNLVINSYIRSLDEARYF